MLSTMVLPDLCEYPDSGKLGVFGSSPFHDRDGRSQAWIPRDAEVGYDEGDEVRSA